MDKKPVSPKCPGCGVAGIEHFVSKESTSRSRYREPWFFVIYCDQCGHVYNVIAKHVLHKPRPEWCYQMRVSSKLIMLRIPDVMFEILQFVHEMIP